MRYHIFSSWCCHFFALCHGFFHFWYMESHRLQTPVLHRHNTHIDESFGQAPVDLNKISLNWHHIIHTATFVSHTNKYNRNICVPLLYVLMSWKDHFFYSKCFHIKWVMTFQKTELIGRNPNDDDKLNYRDGIQLTIPQQTNSQKIPPHKSHQLKKLLPNHDSEQCCTSWNGDYHSSRLFLWHIGYC